MSEISARDCLNAVMLEEAKLKFIKGDVTEAWIDLILTAQKDNTYKRKYHWEPSEIYVLPDLSVDEIEEADGKLRKLYQKDYVTTQSGARTELNNRVFLDSKGITIFRDLEQFLPEEKGMERRKKRLNLMLREFYGLSNSSIRKLFSFELMRNANEKLPQSYAIENWGTVDKMRADGVGDLQASGLVFYSPSQERFHLTARGFRFRQALLRCSYKPQDFPDPKRSGALSLFTGGLVPSFHREKRPLEDPTDLNLGRDGLLVTASKLIWCWQHRNDPPVLENWIAPTLDPGLVEAQEKLLALDNKLYEVPELPPIMNWTVEDQRKQNDDYWNSRGPDGKTGPGAFWLNPAAHAVGPLELPDYGAEPTDPPEWWTPRKPKVEKQDTYMRDVLAKAMEAPTSNETEEAKKSPPLPIENKDFYEAGYDEDYDDWLDRHNERQRKMPKGTGLKLDDRGLAGFGIMVETDCGIVGFATIDQARKFCDAYKHFTGSMRSDLSQVSKLADYHRTAPDYISPENHKLLDQAKQDAALMAAKRKAIKADHFMPPMKGRPKAAPLIK